MKEKEEQEEEEKGGGETMSRVISGLRRSGLETRAGHLEGEPEDCLEPGNKIAVSAVSPHLHQK